MNVIRKERKCVFGYRSFAEGKVHTNLTISNQTETKDLSKQISTGTVVAGWCYPACASSFCTALQPFIRRVGVTKEMPSVERPFLYRSIFQKLFFCIVLFVLYFLFLFFFPFFHTIFPLSFFLFCLLPVSPLPRV